MTEQLADGSETASFLELMSAAGSRDGRDVMRALEPLHTQGILTRDEDGRYRMVEKNE